MKTKITKLAIFDFDGTLIDTPLPTEGKMIYQEKTGLFWPHQGWWGRELSLDMNVFDMPVIQEVIDAYNIEKEQPSTALVMLTGRREILRQQVLDILDSHKLEFNEYHLNRGGATEVAKMRTIEKLLSKYNHVTDVEAWDDRMEHIPIFEAFGQRLIKDKVIKTFKINHVIQNRH